MQWRGKHHNICCDCTELSETGYEWPFFMNGLTLVSYILYSFFVSCDIIDGFSLDVASMLLFGNGSSNFFHGIDDITCSCEHYIYITLIIQQYYQIRMKQFHYMINMKSTYKKHVNLLVIWRCNKWRYVPKY